MYAMLCSIVWDLFQQLIYSLQFSGDGLQLLPMNQILFLFQEKVWDFSFLVCNCYLGY